MASKTTKDHKYTDEEKDFLRENIKAYTYPQLANEFNKKFSTNLSHENISNICIRRLNIKRDKPYHFEKGRKDFNSHPIGAERFDGQVLWIKIKDDYHAGSGGWRNQNSNWVKKHVYVYEQKYGQIPSGYMIVFLDKNKKNCALENLYCVERKVNFMMAKNGWYTKIAENTLTAIKWCELFYSME